MGIKISIVIPTFKRPELLTRCLAALRDQSFLPADYEVIVITDGPDIATKNRVISFTNQYSLSNIMCTSLESKAGPAAARNKGVRLSTGELIAFTDDDCIPDKHWLQNYWRSFCEENKKEIALTGKTIVPHNDIPTDYEKNIANLETAEFITANCACTKGALDKVCGFDEEFPVAWREDSDLQFRLMAASVPIIKVEEAVIVHPVRKAPWGISLKEQKKSMYNALLLKKHPLLYKEKIRSKPLWNYYAMILSLAVAIIGYLDHKPLIGTLSIFYWLLLVTFFTCKRLKKTSKKSDHVIEMIATSMLIPFLSVFWTLYGSFSYKKLLL